MAYQRPMVTVDQNMTVTPTSIERDQPAFVFGPNYELHRYEDADEKDGTAAGTYEGKPLSLPYPGVVDDEAVDRDYTKLYGDNVVVAITEEAAATYEDKTVGDVECGKIDFNFGSAKISVGTLIRVTVDGGDSDDSSSGESAANEIFTKVIAYVKASEGTTALPAGIYIEDQVEVPTGASVKAQIVDVVSGVSFERKNKVAGSGYQWEQPKTKLTDDETETSFYGVKVNKLYALLRYSGDPEGGKYYEVVSADLFISYRELVTSYADAIHSVVGASEVANALGAVSPDNPLAMGVYMAALNAASDSGNDAPPVYFMAVPTDDLKGYNDVLSRASLTDRIYILAPTTQDEGVLEAVRAHVEAMSVKTVKKWRIAAASAKVDTEVARLNAKMNPSDENFYAVVSAGNIIKVVKDSTSTAGNPNTAFRTTLVPGDTVKLFSDTPDAWGEPVYDTYTVKRIKNNYMVEVEEDVAASQTPAKIEIYHTYTDAQFAEQVAATSKSMASRRMLNVFPTLFSGNGVTMTGEFAACAVAGLVSSTDPQQPITNVTVRGIDDIPLVYQTFSNADLDVMAAGGTFIVAQDMPGDVVYVRHQITTAYPDGNLNTAELSVTKNVDSISYAFSDLFRPYYGKNNITDELIAIFNNITYGLITRLGTSGEFGPQLISYNTYIRYIRQNPLVKDHVDIAISIAVPYPCNNIDIVLTV